MSEVRFSFELTDTDCDLSDLELSEDASADDVIAKMQETGSLRQVLIDWNLLDVMTVRVVVANDRGISEADWQDWL